MARRNTTRFAVLGMLSYMPMSGYDMKKFSDNSLNHFWKENYGAIYPVLGRLESEGLISQVEGEGGGRADRRVYDLTPEGRDALDAWLTEMPEVPVLRVEILLKLFFGHWGDPKEMIAMVEEYRDYCRRLTKEIEGIGAHIEGDKAAILGRLAENSAETTNVDGSPTGGECLPGEGAQGDQEQITIKKAGYPFWMMTVNYGRLYYKAGLQWAEETLEALRRLPKYTPRDRKSVPGEEER